MRLTFQVSSSTCHLHGIPPGLNAVHLPRPCLLSVHLTLLQLPRMHQIASCCEVVFSLPPFNCDSGNIPDRTIASFVRSMLGVSLNLSVVMIVGTRYCPHCLCQSLVSLDLVPLVTLSFSFHIAYTSSLLEPHGSTDTAHWLLCSGCNHEASRGEQPS